MFFDPVNINKKNDRAFHTVTFKALGSKNKLLLYCDDLARLKEASEAVVKETKRIEKKYSRYNLQSDLSRVNQSAGIKSCIVDKEFCELFNYAEICFIESDGLFDITLGILRNVWDWKSKQPPHKQKITKLLDSIGWDKVEWNSLNQTIYLPNKNMQIDFGGIGKEYAVDRARKILEEYGIENGVIDFAGDIFVLGPHLDGTAWKVAIAHPRNEQQVISNIDIKKGGLATSGDYERYFIYEGKRYYHLLNPSTGYPTENPFQSVSVVAKSCLEAGSMASIAMLKGYSEGLSWLRKSGVSFLAINPDGKILSD